MPIVSGSDLTGVVKLDSMDDAKVIINSARKTKVAVVVGGGITALELVEGLVTMGVKVHYFLRGERFAGDNEQSGLRIEWFQDFDNLRAIDIGDKMWDITEEEIPGF